VAAVPGRRWTAARLPKIADGKKPKLRLAGLRGEFPHIGRQGRMAELPVPFRMHDHPPGPLHGKRGRTLHTAGAGLTHGQWNACLGRGHLAPARIESSHGMFRSRVEYARIG